MAFQQLSQEIIPCMSAHGYDQLIFQLIGMMIAAIQKVSIELVSSFILFIFHFYSLKFLILSFSFPPSLLSISLFLSPFPFPLPPKWYHFKANVMQFER